MFGKEYEIEVDGSFNLTETIESGQTFLWNRVNGDIFDNETNGEYVTCRNINGELIGINVRQKKDNLLVYSNSSEAPDLVRNYLGLFHDVESIKKSILELDTADGIMEEAINTYPGLRIVNEPIFPTLISFICSTQMRVERIHEMVNSMKERYGSSLDTEVGEIHAFPTPRELSKADEQDLKNLKLGYRAGYVSSTVETYLKSGIELPEDAGEARSELQKFKGVGTKVADCVLLYGSDMYSVVPVDTWIESAIENYYPTLNDTSNKKTARNFESQFGEYSGFAQGYLFHYTRTKN